MHKNGKKGFHFFKERTETNLTKDSWGEHSLLETDNKMVTLRCTQHLKHTTYN